MKQPVTSFALLKKADACSERYLFLARKLGTVKAYGKDTPITLLQILEANGLDDATWALRACPDSDRFAREFACDCAAHVLPIFQTAYPKDDRPAKAIEVVRRFARGEASDSERAAAGAAARAAARDAERDAAWAAAWAAARDAAGAAEQKWQETRLREMIAEREAEAVKA